jgi:hypothetical protein
LRRLLRIHINWLTVKLLGKELVSKEELAELKDYGRLSLGDEVGLVERSFILGRTSATGKKSDYKDLTLDKLSRLQKRKFSNAEQLALREAKLHTSRRIQALADDAAAGASARVNRATQELLTDATVKEILEDEIAIALAEKKSRQELASSVGNSLGRDLTSGLKKLMVSEMHRAKTRGVAMAIANKVDIYASSEGVESTVSVVPNRDACEDCRNLYLTDTGNPRTFKLSDLVGQGSNSDEGVSHSRKGGLHLGWKPVLPPAHPNCYCELTYVPPGMAWENGRLRVVDELRYKNQISKAVDKGTMSATITPKGPPGAKDDTPKVGSLKGVPDPGREGRPPSAQTTAEASTSPPAWESGPGAKTQPAKQGEEAAAPDNKVPCPYGGGTDCTDHGGSGGKMHDPNGESMEEHRKHDDFKDRVEEDQRDPQQVAEEHVAKMLISKDYDSMSKPMEVMKDHIVNGTIIDSKPMKGHGGSIHESYKRTIDGNGSYLGKPGSTEFGSAVHREAAASDHQSYFGSDRCPPTFVRTKGPIAESGQVWLEGYDNAFSRMEEVMAERSPRELDDRGSLVYAILDAAPDKDIAVEQMSTIAVQDIVLCNSDRHIENFMLDEDYSDIRAIDHGFCYEVGLNYYSSAIHDGFYQNNRPLRIPPAMREIFDNTTFGDLKRAGGDEHLQEWQTAQTYLRMKYVMHVADNNEGKLPLDEFRSKGFGFGASKSAFRDNGSEKFEDFMVDYIDEHSKNEESPEYATAKHFAEVGVFMPPWIHQAEPEAHATELGKGGHYQYEQYVRTEKAVAEAAKRGNKDWSAQEKEKHEKEVLNLNKEELEAAKKNIFDLGRAYDTSIDDFFKWQEDNPGIMGDKFMAEQDKTDAAMAALNRGRIEEDLLKKETRKLQLEERDKFQVMAERDVARFEELDKKIAAAQTGTPRGRKQLAYRMEPGTSTRSAADIESEKRQIKPKDPDLEGLGWANRARGPGKNG